MLIVCSMTIYPNRPQRIVTRPPCRADSRIRRRKSADKNTVIRIIKWNQHSNKWLACYLKWIIIVISKLLVITDGCRFCNNNKNRQQQHVHRLPWQSFQFRFNSSVEIVCNQLNFSRKMFVVSRLLAEFLVCAIIRLIWISADFSPAIHIFFILQIGSLIATDYNPNPKTPITTLLEYKKQHARLQVTTNPNFNPLRSVVVRCGPLR